MQTMKYFIKQAYSPGGVITGRYYNWTVISAGPSFRKVYEEFYDICTTDKSGLYNYRLTDRKGLVIAELSDIKEWFK